MLAQMAALNIAIIRPKIRSVSDKMTLTEAAGSSPASLCRPTKEKENSTNRYHIFKIL